jgi:hypothetical protein
MLNSRIGQRWIFRSNSGWLGGNRITDLSVLSACSAFVLMGLLMLTNVLTNPVQADAAADWPLKLMPIAASWTCSVCRIDRMTL